MEYLLEAVSPQLQYLGIKLNNRDKVSIASGKIYAVVGANGSGKTTLANILSKGWNIGMNKILGDKKSLKIKTIEFSDIHSLTGCKDSYYQQRFEAAMNDDIPTVGDLIRGKIGEETWQTLCNRLSLQSIDHKAINCLSSGELRKFLIVNLLSENPNILILDNPYIGLDAPSRDLLDELLLHIAKSGTAVMLLLCNPTDIPQFTNYIIPIENLTILPTIDISQTDIATAIKSTESLFPQKGLGEIPVNEHHADSNFANAFELHDCKVKYGQTTILEHVDWMVKRGERWALLGANGAGKSTLLSLVCADNPQSYSNNITLFDRRRGTGESIWDIKRHIGYLSPEMHLYFRDARDITAVVASGLRDTVGMYVHEPQAAKELASKWLATFGLENLASRRFDTLSSGEQRLVLLMRTLIKNPPVLILDEPLHGLDAINKQLAKSVIEKTVMENNATLVYVTHYQNEIPSIVDKVKILTKHI